MENFEESLRDFADQRARDSKLQFKGKAKFTESDYAKLTRYLRRASPASRFISREEHLSSVKALFFSDFDNTFLERRINACGYYLR